MAKKVISIKCTAALKAMLDGDEAEQEGRPDSRHQTGRAFQKRYFSRRWDEAFTAAKLTDDLHFHDIRGTTVTLLAEAGCSVGEIAAVTGHSVRSAQGIIDRYLARTAYLANAAIDKFEARPVAGTKPEPAKWPTKRN